MSISLHDRFLRLLPRIERHGRVYFRHVQCRQKKADYIAEMIALCWKWMLRLETQGKDGFQFPTALATYAAKQVKSGRRVCGQEKAKDAMSPTAQQRHGFVVGKLPDYSTLDGNPLAEALHDNTRTPPPDAAAFRIDFPAWLATRTERDRRIIEQMGLNHRTSDLARRFGVVPGRISQLRREYQEDWTRFTA
jgi:hypothetical protein